MDDLHSHIQQTFSAFSGYDDYDAQLTLWAWQRRASAAEATRIWRASRPPEHCSQCKRRRTPGKKVCWRHLEIDRERARARYAANPERERERTRTRMAAKRAATRKAA